MSYANLSYGTLTGANLSNSNLTNASLMGAVLSGANLSGATVAGANFGSSNLSASQLYITASYQAKELQGIVLGGNDLTGWNLAGQDLTLADLSHCTLVNSNLANSNLTSATLNSAMLTGATLAGAAVVATDFGSTNLTASQLYTTGSYATKNLQDIDLDSNDLTGWNFAGQNLSGANLSYGTLTGVNLAGANMTSANLNSATLANANLAGADRDLRRLRLYWHYLLATLRHGQLPGEKFEGHWPGEQRPYRLQLRRTKLERRESFLCHVVRREPGGANLAAALLTGSTLNCANLTGANLTNATLDYGTLTGSTLTNANLTGASLYYTSLANANLSGANLTNATLNAATLTGANLSGASLYNALLTSVDLTGANLSGANLSGSTLAGATVVGANLTNAILHGATLSDADFTNANLQRAVFSYAALDGTILSGADLRGASGLSDSASAASLANAIFPDGTIQGLTLDPINPLLVVRDYTGPTPIPIQVIGGMTVASGGTLQVVFDGPTWGSTISFSPSSAATLGGNLDLELAPGVNPGSLLGVSFQLFNWANASVSGSFSQVTSSLPTRYSWNTSRLTTAGTVDLTLANGQLNGQWATNGGGNWSAGTNWSNGNVPGAPQDTASFGAALTGGTGTVILDTPISLASLSFSPSGGGSYVLCPSPSGSLTLSNTAGAATISNSGENTIAATISLDSNLNVKSAAGGILIIAGNIASGGSNSLTFTGLGELILSGSNSYGGGTIVESGTVVAMNCAAIADGTNLTIGNPAAFATVNSAASAADHAGSPSAATPVPEPGTLALLAAVCAAAIGRCRRRRHTRGGTGTILA